ncbi:leucine-rich repeat domain-containing protein [Paraflavisolibacter caeni]|nr:leucine-rich repeat domain-containing protein [Paraflavisolibacter caeni]
MITINFQISNEQYIFSQTDVTQTAISARNILKPLAAKLYAPQFMKQALTFLLFFPLSVTLFGQDTFFRPTYVFKGSIITDKGQELKVNMNFLVLLDSTLVGSYYYKPSNGSLKLVGQLNSDNTFVLVERNERDNITGYFNGTLAVDKKAASGEWTTPSKDKQFSFLLSRIEGKSYWDYIKKNRSLYEYSNLNLAIKESDKVFCIDVASQGLNKLPKQLDRLKNVVSINLLGNEFTSFPTILTHLTSLDEISLSSNRLKTVGREIKHLKNLRILILNNNQLTELPKEIGELSNLLYLEIGNNKLKRLPDEIKYLINLQELHIERNSLSEAEKLKIKRLLPNTVVHF